MSWTKLSDDFSDDCWTLSSDAFRLHVEGLNWSNRKLLDLRLAKDEMRTWAKHPEAAPELVAVGWWRDDGDAYVIIHHGVYQRPRAQVLRLQERNWENGQKGGRPPGPPREQAQRPRSGTQPETQVGFQAPCDGENAETQVGFEQSGKSPSENPTGNPFGNPKGQDRPGQEENRGTSPSEAAENDTQADKDYAADYRAWLAEEELPDHRSNADRTPSTEEAIENAQSILGGEVIKERP